MVQELWSENQHFGMSPKYHSVPCQGAHVYTGSGESTGLDVKKHALSDEQIISRCRKCFGAVQQRTNGSKSDHFACFVCELCGRAYHIRDMSLIWLWVLWVMYRKVGF